MNGTGFFFVGNQNLTALQWGIDELSTAAQLQHEQRRLHEHFVLVQVALDGTDLYKLVFRHPTRLVLRQSCHLLASQLRVPVVRHFASCVLLSEVRAGENEEARGKEGNGHLVFVFLKTSFRPNLQRTRSWWPLSFARSHVCSELSTTQSWLVLDPALTWCTC
jgi:hypothetical protein